MLVCDSLPLDGLMMMSLQPLRQKKIDQDGSGSPSFAVLLLLPLGSSKLTLTLILISFVCNNYLSVRE